MTNASRVKPEYEHATDTDFCRMFKDQTDCLYTLAFLLVADHSIAEECFAAGLEDCLNTHVVFKEWALSWCKRAVIKNAIRLAAPKRTRDREAVPLSYGTDSRSTFAQAVIQLEQFERFVFVMSILEGYSDKECGVLLNCTAQEVASTRNESIRQLAKTVGPRPAAALLRQESGCPSPSTYPLFPGDTGRRGEGAAAGNFQ